MNRSRETFMSRDSILPGVALVLALAVGACGGDQVAVQVADSPTGADSLRPVEDVEVQLLPYDRDSIFDALTEMADEPEPEIPDTLRAMIQEVSDRQQEWRDADAEWQTLRDSLRNIRQRMNGMNEASDEYRALFDRFSNVESRVNSLEAAKEDAFERFDALQQQTLSFADSIRILRDAWAEEAYRSYTAITDSIMASRDVEARYDTTGADGWVQFNFPSGDWWVHTRVSGPYEELYWNVPIPADADSLRLTPDNAEVRLRL